MNKSTLFWVRMDTPLDGPRMASLGPRSVKLISEVACRNFECCQLIICCSQLLEMSIFVTTCMTSSNSDQIIWSRQICWHLIFLQGPYYCAVGAGNVSLLNLIIMFILKEMYLLAHTNRASGNISPYSHLLLDWGVQYGYTLSSIKVWRGKKGPG